ncbi:MAG: hypothetical protein KDC18_03530 [Alphaproteobacteria bacterium]|nr:hypothetical protein [Alphaproteobacteria bacterium]MCB9928390.1 hypothetical protein [Alphaproteobacteria bacterium]
MQKPVIIAIVVAAAIIATFVFGSLFQEKHEGPLENLGEKLDQKLN